MSDSDVTGREWNLNLHQAINGLSGFGEVSREWR